jgi:hypothetical protein
MIYPAAVPTYAFARSVIVEGLDDPEAQVGVVVEEVLDLAAVRAHAHTSTAWRLTSRAAISGP